MKKLIVSLVLLMGLSFNANADPATAALNAASASASIPFIAIPLGVMYAASTVKYEACNDLPYVTAKASNGNYFYKTSQCKK